MLASPVLGDSSEHEHTYDDEKWINKSYKVGMDSELEIINKYGDIVVETGQTDSIIFKIHVKVYTDKLARIDDLLDVVDVRFSSGDDYVAAETTWGNNGVSAFRVDLINVMSNNRKVEVDYHIIIPEDCEIDISNKFGHVTLPTINSTVKLDVSHGNIRARELTDVKQIKHEYGKMNIKKMRDADLILHFADVNIDEAEQLRIESVSSEIEIEEVEKVSVDSKHDKFRIEELKTWRGNTMLSDTKIDKLTGTVNGSVKYGEFTIEAVDTRFMGIELEGVTTDIELGFNSQIAYHYEVELENGKRFVIPTDGNTADETDDSGDTHHFTGLFATMPIGGKPANVIIDAKSSYVTFDIDD